MAKPLRIKPCSRTNDSRGFSLVEILVAMSIMTITVGGVMLMVSDNTQTNVFKGSVQGKSVCLTEAQRILSNIKERGLVRQGYNMNTLTEGTNAQVLSGVPLAPTSLGGTTLTAPGTGASLEPGLSTAQRWSATLPVYDFALTPPTIRPNMLIMGYMNTVQAIYNSDRTNFCTTANGYQIYSKTGSATNPFPAIFTPTTSTDFRTLDEYVKIEYYNLATGSVDASCPAGNVRPPRSDETKLTSDATLPTGLTTTNHPSSGIQAYRHDATSAHNRAYKVTATVSYTDASGLTRDCKAEEIFRWSMQPSNTLTLQIVDAETTVSDTDVSEELNTTITSTGVANPPHMDNSFDASPPHYLACNASYSKNLKMRLVNTRPGSIHMCRNLSNRRYDDRVAVSGGTRLTLSYKQAQTFYSSELQSVDYFGAQGSDAENLRISGIYIPNGTYYCKSVDSCAGLPFLPRGPSPVAYFPDPFYTQEAGVRYYKPENHSQRTDMTWEPCERIEICGRTATMDGGVQAGINATTAGFVAGTNSKADAYHLTFTNVPDGCDVHVQIAEIDSAYNITTTTFKEYMQERVPGNKLCYNGAGAGRVTTNYADDEWFFACTGGSNPYSMHTCVPATDETSNKGSLPRTGCCLDYPFFKQARALAPTTFTPPNSCTLPWGGSTADGTSTLAYRYGTHADCASQSGYVVCDDGVLISNGYNYQTCSAPAAGCTLPWGGTIASGASVTAYAAGAGTPTCTSELRTCSGTTLSGTYTNQTCVAGCNLPWGGYIASGNSVNAYSSAAPAGACSTVVQTRTCTAGTLSGTFTNQTCCGNGGSTVGGYCWHYGADNASCSATCSANGGYNAATLSYAGSGGSNGNCDAVLTALGAPSVAISNGSSWGGLGCVYFSGSSGSRVRHTPTTTESTTHINTRRACACTN